MCLSSSNSATERVLSLLTTCLSDRRLIMRHDTMEDYLIIAGNQRAWSEQEKNELITRAVDKYLEKRRTKQLDFKPSTPKSVRVETISSDESEYKDSEVD